MAITGLSVCAERTASTADLVSDYDYAAGIGVVIRDLESAEFEGLDSLGGQPV
tara:strand:- start:1409 stop:1567 length:159 start_codon:yes stop_codon:yes gene_type:complete